MQLLSHGVKFYVEPTTGNDVEYQAVDFEPGAKRWSEVAHPTQPIIVHAEERVIEDVIARFAGGKGESRIQHPLHIPHIASRIVLDAVIAGKKQGWPVTGGVCPQHLFLDEANKERLGWFARMKPALGTAEDREYLWANLEAIDVIETDHAPHTTAEKERANQENPTADTDNPVKYYGVPGLEAVIPLFMRAVRTGALSLEQFVRLASVRPAEIIGLRRDPSSRVLVSLEDYEFEPKPQYSKAVYPYLGRSVTGKIVAVDFHGERVVENGRVSEKKPYGRVLAPAGSY
jgi:dihydroorotase